MLNMRLARPSMLVDLNGPREVEGITPTAHGLHSDIAPRRM